MSGTGGGRRPVVVVDPDCVPADRVDETVIDLHRRVRPDQLEWIEARDLDHPDTLGPFTPAVVACGGDVVVRACIAAVAGTTIALGIVPLGNQTAVGTELGKRRSTDLTPGDALVEALTGPLRRIDLGDVNGELFATVAGFGAEVMTPADPLGRSAVARVVSSVRRLRRQFGPVTVHVDGVQCYAGRTPVVLVGNGARLVAPGPPVEVFPGAGMADGDLDVGVLVPRTIIGWVPVLWRLIRGQPQPSSLLRRFSGNWVHVRSPMPRGFDVDGLRRTPVVALDARVWPGALLVREPERPTSEPGELDLPVTTMTGDRDGQGRERWVEAIDGTCPVGYPVKVNERSGIYHVPGGRSYDRTRATRCYPAPADASGDGYRPARA